MNNDNNKNVAIHLNKFKMFKVRLVKMSNDDYGVTQPKYNRILVNYNKPKYIQIYTILHERIHEVIDKIFGFEYTSARVNGLHDLIDYLLQDFRFTYRYYIVKNGYRHMINLVLNRYVEKWGMKE